MGVAECVDWQVHIGAYRRHILCHSQTRTQGISQSPIIFDQLRTFPLKDSPEASPLSSILRITIYHHLQQFSVETF
jgi:hypothetical protein